MLGRLEGKASQNHAELCRPRFFQQARRRLDNLCAEQVRCKYDRAVSQDAEHQSPPHRIPPIPLGLTHSLRGKPSLVDGRVGPGRALPTIQCVEYRKRARDDKSETAHWWKSAHLAPAVSS